MIVSDLCRLVRAKNAGPFRLTIDCFGKDESTYTQLTQHITTQTVAEALSVNADEVQRFELDELHVLKFGLPRPLVQGSPGDRDLHGAQWAHVVAALPVGSLAPERRIATVTLVARDYDEAISWYTSRLGFVLKEDTPIDGKRWVVLSTNATGPDLLITCASDTEQTAHIGNQTGGRVAFFLESDDFERDYADFSAAGVTFLEAPRHESYASVAVFEDLYGNRWDLLQRNQR